uniref:Uncharacterized protein n=1 Tax=Cacopsylla melanoneura TaxID=428564 RepID=A0A8D8SFE2_9HEMI
MFKETVINWERYLPLHLKRLWVQFPLVANISCGRGSFSLPVFLFPSLSGTIRPSDSFFFSREEKSLNKIEMLIGYRIRASERVYKKLYFSLESLLSTLLRTFRK